VVLKAAGLVGERIKCVKVIKTGALTRQGHAQRYRRNGGPKAAIEAAGGSIAAAE
jgi:large subunit ribosomal protein L15